MNRAMIQVKDVAASFLCWTLLLSVGLFFGVFAPQAVLAQDRPPERQLRTYIPPDQIVSFSPSTPFGQFVDILNPIFERVTGKGIVDPQDRTDPIGVSIAGMYFLDAFELALEYNGLTYRETERYFLIEEAPEAETEVPAAQAAAAIEDLLATLDSREVQISAVLFEMNLSKARQLGLDWNVFFGGQTASGGGTGGTTGGGGGQQRARFFLRTDDIFDSVDDYILAPEVIDFAQLTQFFRLLEEEGVGETIAQPSITVQSGEEGRIQIGSDIPVQVRDFAGNTITQFVSTGIIVDVTPTLFTEPVADTTGAPLLDFIHLNVQVERSNGRPFGASIAVDRSTADTQVLLLNGEQTIIGGLYSTDVTTNRRGVPLLKDLPPWFFGLRYVFGFEQKSLTNRELVIALQARLVDPLEARADRPRDDELLEEHRRRVREAILRFDEEKGQQHDIPQPQEQQ